MLTISALLFAMGLLGATDILVFHVHGHALRERVDSRAELVTHALRGPTYAVLFLVVPNYELNGGWYLALLGLLAVDALISVVDFWLEPESRRSAGGLPRGEYLLHVILAALFGALVFAIASQGSERIQAPNSIQWIPLGAIDIEALLRMALMAMSPVVLWTGGLDLLAVVRLGRPST